MQASSCVRPSALPAPGRRAVRPAARGGRLVCCASQLKDRVAVVTGGASGGCWVWVEAWQALRALLAACRLWRRLVVWKGDLEARGVLQKHRCAEAALPVRRARAAAVVVAPTAKRDSKLRCCIAAAHLLRNVSLPTQESARLPRDCLQRKGRKWWWQVRPLRCTVLLPASRGLRAHWARLCLRAGPRALSTDPLSKAGFTSPNLQTGADLQLDRARQLASELGEGQAFAQVCWSCCLGCWPAAVTRVLAAKLLGTKVVARVLCIT